MSAYEKFERLKNILRDMGSILVVFSGEEESLFLLKSASDVLGNRVSAASVISNVFSSCEMEEAEKLAGELGVEHTNIFFDPLDEVQGFGKNSDDRCYRCRKYLFSKIVHFAENNGVRHVVNGTCSGENVDCISGQRAIEELNIKSPLLMAGLTRSDIEELAYGMGLSIKFTAPVSCLADRIENKETISKEKLHEIGSAEDYIMSKGIMNVRVKYHDRTARIEVGKAELYKFFSVEFMNDIDNKLKEIGFEHVSLDLSGY